MNITVNHLNQTCGHITMSCANTLNSGLLWDISSYLNCFVNSCLHPHFQQCTQSSAHKSYYDSTIDRMPTKMTISNNGHVITCGLRLLWSQVTTQLSKHATSHHFIWKCWKMKMKWCYGTKLKTNNDHFCPNFSFQMFESQSTYMYKYE